LKKQKQTSPADMLKSIFTRPVLTWFFGNCMANLSFYIILSLASYYFIYVANSKAMMGTFFGMNNALVFVGALTAPWIAKFFKWDGRKVYIYGLCMTCICALLTFLFGKTAVMFAVLLALCSVGFGSCMSVDIAVIGNIAQCLSIEKKKDVSTFIFSLSFIPANLATIFQGLILGFGLHIIGFDPAMQAASDAFVNGLRVIMSLFPAIATAIGIVCMWLYPYSEKRMIEITASESKAV
jgi:GPH family glycoside/pentoside/hexuronide:cation symporter